MTMEWVIFELSTVVMTCSISLGQKGLLNDSYLKRTGDTFADNRRE